MKLLTFVTQIKNIYLDSFLFSTVTRKAVDIFLAKMKELVQVIVRLQLKDCTAQKESVYFEYVMEAFPILKAWLGAGVRIAQVRGFESEVVQLQKKKEKK